jgi:hypothetical protein
LTCRKTQRCGQWNDHQTCSKDGYRHWQPSTGVAQGDQLFKPLLICIKCRRDEGHTSDTFSLIIFRTVEMIGSSETDHPIFPSDRIGRIASGLRTNHDVNSCSARVLAVPLLLRSLPHFGMRRLSLEGKVLFSPFPFQSSCLISF